MIVSSSDHETDAKRLEVRRRRRHRLVRRLLIPVVLLLYLVCCSRAFRSTSLRDPLMAPGQLIPSDPWILSFFVSSVIGIAVGSAVYLLVFSGCAGRIAGLLLAVFLAFLHMPVITDHGPFVLEIQNTTGGAVEVTVRSERTCGMVTFRIQPKEKVLYTTSGMILSPRLYPITIECAQGHLTTSASELYKSAAVVNPEGVKLERVPDTENRRRWDNIGRAGEIRRQPIPP